MNIISVPENKTVPRESSRSTKGHGLDIHKS